MPKTHTLAVAMTGTGHGSLSISLEHVKADRPPRPPWGREWVEQAQDEVVDLLLQVDWAGIWGKLEKLQNFFFRRRVREA